MPSVTIIGIGRVGGALEIAFRGTDHSVEALIGRHGSSRLENTEHISSDIVLITTPDNEIANVARKLAGKVEKATIVLHTSGALSSGVLSALADAGCGTGSMHPLVSISSPEIGAKRFVGAYFCVEGDERSILAAKSIVQLLGGYSFEIQAADKALYHASAVTACGHVTALIDMAISMMHRAGVDLSLSTEILGPLIQSTIDNLRELGPAAALTGTFARADSDGLRRQLSAFENKLTAEELEIYLDLARRSLGLAIENGVDPSKIAETDALISMAKSKLR